MNFPIWPGSRLYRVPSVCLLVIFCLGCSTTPKSLFEIGGEQFDSGITLEGEQRINIYTKDERIVSMSGHKIKAKNIERKLLVVDSGDVNGYFVVFDMEEVKSITVGEVDPYNPASRTYETFCILIFLSTFMMCGEGPPSDTDKVEWVTRSDNKIEDYKIAFKWYQQAADQDDPIAMVNLGSMYAEGQGVTQDYNAALEWYKLAADQGDPIAMANLGDMYAVGRGVSQDNTAALKWYELAVAHGIAEAKLRLGLLHIKAEQGDARAQNDLGYMYEAGRDVTRDYEAAFKWYKLAAEQGHAQAQSNLGYMYEEGLGVPRDYEAALEWYKLAAEQGNAVGQDYKAALEWYLHNAY